MEKSGFMRIASVSFLMASRKSAICVISLIFSLHDIEGRGS